ncbi:MAG: O-antigen ligase family protein [Putridiphycobacter sp.]|nr:O-antigen ligase family protein [Putridiphycobacter sp.]
MGYAYKYYAQFIMLMVIIYTLGVFIPEVVYVLFPVVLFLLGYKKFFFELLVLSILFLILSDYVPISSATRDSLQFAKDLKFLAPITLFAFFLFYREDFDLNLSFIVPFIPFFLIACIALFYSLNISTGIQKTISFAIMYFTVPLYVLYLHKTYGSVFWSGLITFLVGILLIGLVLGIVIPQIGIHSGGRFKGALGNPNGVGIYAFLVTVIYTLIKDLKLANFTKRENLLIVLAIFLTIIWCESRNAIMSTLLFLVTYRLVKINWLLAIIIVTSIIIFEEYLFAVIIAIIEFVGMESYFRVNTIEEGSGRKIAWIFAWQEIQKYFFIGGGFGHDENIMRPNYYWLERAGHNGGVHNSYLSMWFDTGIVGLIAYYTAYLYNLLKNMQGNYMVLAFVVSVGFNINYESWLVGSLNPFTILFLIILSVFTFQIKPEVEHLEVQN